MDCYLASISSLPNTPILNEKSSDLSSSPNKRPPPLTPVKLISPIKSPARRDFNVFSPKKPRNTIIYRLIV